ncbi:hypothetical protein CR513_17729, partial [Mucuna pruriens]
LDSFYFGKCDCQLKRFIMGFVNNLVTLGLGQEAAFVGVVLGNFPSIIETEDERKIDVLAEFLASLKEPNQTRLPVPLGHNIPQILQIWQSSVAMLVDSGSTQDCITNFLGLATVQHKISMYWLATTSNYNVPLFVIRYLLTLGGQLFHIDLYILQFSGVDLVLGVQWLKTLGPVLTDYETLIMKFIKDDDVVQLRAPKSLPPICSTDHKIPLLQGSNPVTVRPYCYPHSKSKRWKSSFMKCWILLVHKKDRTWCFCVEYRALNALTSKDRFPIPFIDELLDDLHGTQWFTKLDLRSDYHYIRMNPDDIHKMAFQTHEGHNEFLVMPFRLCNALATFQATMNLLFQPYLRHFVIVFFNDIFVYSESLEEHVSHLRSLKPWFLGLRQLPSNNFIGFRGYWFLLQVCQRLFFHCCPFDQPLKKDVFVWTSDAQQSFEQLKQTIIESLTLALP